MSLCVAIAGITDPGYSCGTCRPGLRPGAPELKSEHRTFNIEPGFAKRLRRGKHRRKVERLAVAAGATH